MSHTRIGVCLAAAVMVCGVARGTTNIPRGSGQLHLIVPDDARVKLSAVAEKGKTSKLLCWDLNRSKFRYFQIQRLPSQGPSRIRVEAMRTSGQQELRAESFIDVMANTTQYLRIPRDQFKPKAEPKQLAYLFLPIGPAAASATMAAAPASSNQFLFSTPAELTAFVQYDDQGANGGVATHVRFALGRGQTDAKLKGLQLVHKFPPSLRPASGGKCKVVLTVKWTGKGKNAKRECKTPFTSGEFSFSYPANTQEGTASLAEFNDSGRLLREWIEREIPKQVSLLDRPSKITITGHVHFAGTVEKIGNSISVQLLEK